MAKEKTSIKIIKNLKKDLDLDKRAFLKRHAKNLKGPGKLALLVFFITRARKQSVSSNGIENEWNNVKSILGKHNPAYLTRARDYGFLKKDDTKKKHYKLTNSWFKKLIQKYPRWIK